MTKIERQIELIERLDRLIRMQATGNPQQLARRLDISKASLFRIFEVMKRLNAPIIFDIGLQSYIYEEQVSFRFGFYTRDLQGEEILEISGGSFQRILMEPGFNYPYLRIV
ncbi:hypothetical protein SAMN04487910_1404 [Aquimarina amphilecti]|uniref:HTH domain-containing protein n=1 Tax=Aquimarina amphilecti TaxID=1038014 RepID=A0A1H7KQU3_AQUAM|nr:hypothetical protein [Aquimarina amphilecti]SEK89159.1 hypothetical protein SAMN04487910_1404 [Aquimarina amphilecti]